MNNLTVETEDTFASLLELAANNDVEGFKLFIEHNFSVIDETGPWYGRQKGSKQMVLLQRTPLMVASTYGSLDVVKLIISLSSSDLNKPRGTDKTTPLHCAASSGSLNAIDVVKALLEAGADPNSVDANNSHPIDVIVANPKCKAMKSSLEELLRTRNLRVSTFSSNSNSPPLSPENGSPSSPLTSNSSPDSSKITKKEYPIDPSLPDIKIGIYSTDEFRMFSFKVRPCSRAYSHDWTECPFVHPGENARRRDPRKFHYSCVPCPDFRKGACRRGDMCEYAHGVFESWLHPAQYRTRICKDGISCDRRVCFFAHTEEELRPLYVSTGSAMSSPTSSDYALAMSLLSSSPSSPFNQPISPSQSNIWAQQNVPSLHLPNSNFHSSRLRTSNLDSLFSAESSFSPTHKSAVMNQFQQHKNVLSPINTSFSPKGVDRSVMHSPFGGPSPGRVDPISPMGPRVTLLREKQPVNFRSLSSRDLGSRSAAAPGGDFWSNLGSNSGKADWTVNADEFGKLRRSSSFELKSNEEGLDFGWVHSLMNESPPEMKQDLLPGPSDELDEFDQTVHGWLEQIHMD